MTASSPAPQKVEPLWPKGLTIFIVVAATLGLRALNLNDPLWLDEMHTSWVDSDSLLDVAPRAAIGNQTPLYFWLNWFVATVYESEISLRLISFLSAGALAGLVADTLWRWCEGAGVPPVGPALCGGLLVAVDPVFIFYGTEARPYALLQLVAFWRLRQLSLLGPNPSREQRIGMIVSGAMMVWLHLTGGLIFAGEFAAIVFWRWQGRASYSLRNWLVDLAIIGVACLPLAWLIVFVFGRRQNFESMIPSPSLEGAFQILHSNELVWPLIVGGSVAIATDIFVSWAARRSTRTTAAESLAIGCLSFPKRFLAIAAAPLIWAVATMLIALVAHDRGVAPLFWGRYLIGVTVASMILAASLCGLRTNLLAVALALAMVATEFQRTNLYWRVFNEDHLGFRAIDDRALSLRSHGSKGSWLDPRHTPPVLVDAGLIERDVSWQSPTALEREYACFPIHTVHPFDVNRRSETWGLPQGWRDAKDKGMLPADAVAKYRADGYIIVAIFRPDPLDQEEDRVVRLIERETEIKSFIAGTLHDANGKVSLFLIKDESRRNRW
jgi:hypothetical protein